MYFFGLQTLKIKETNRVAALKTELLKFGADFRENTDSWIVKPIPKSNLTQDKHYHINTFEDHRMAMAFAALAVRTRLSIDNREVVNKSYPSFWDDLRSIGFIID